MIQRTVGKIIKGVLVVIVTIVAIAVFGLVVKSLWNWLMPALFALPVITFWQAVGLLVLSKILFGGFRGRPGRGIHWRGRMREKWARMSPEERERFEQGMRSRFGRRGCWPDAEKAGFRDASEATK